MLRDPVSAVSDLDDHPIVFLPGRHLNEIGLGARPLGQGLAGDEVEGDGIYSWDCLKYKDPFGQTICPPADATLGTYTLVFTARDQAGNHSATTSRDYELVEPQR